MNYNQIFDVSLMDINDVLIENDTYILLELGDNFNNDWAGFSYWACKQKNELDEEAISSFVYIITWFMTGNPIEINPHFRSDKYYKNDRILNECLKIYNSLLDKCDSEVELCKDLFAGIYQFYVLHHEEYIKSDIRVNCLLTYKEMELFDAIEGDSRSHKLKILLDNYYSK